MTRRLPSRTQILAVGLLLAWAFPFANRTAEAQDPVENLSVSSLSDRIRLISGGSQNVNLTAIRTENGIILVDTGESVEFALAARRILDREFPGATVTHVVNTHAHWDHILGNAAFPEATIIAQKNALKALVQIILPRGAGEQRETRRAESAAAPPPPGTPPPPPRTPLEVHLTPEDYERTKPDLTFSEEYLLREGGVTVELVSYGPAHTSSDVLVLVPSERLLCVGDLFFHNTLPTFGTRLPPEVDRWRRALEKISGEGGRFDRVVSGHGEIIARAEFEAQVGYLFDVWARAGEAVRDGRSLERLQEDLRLDRAFPALAAWDVKSSTGASLHEGNVRTAFQSQDEKTRRSGPLLPYLGQVPPGDIPVVFSPGLISGGTHRLHGFPVFTPNLAEVYWPVIPPRIMLMKEREGVWSAPIVLDLASGNPQAPFLSADGRTLYFQAVLPEGKGGLDIWRSERGPDGWEPPQNLGSPVNTPGFESQPSLTSGGTLYFTGYLAGVAMERGIFRAERTELGYAAPELLPPPINSPSIDYTPFIDPEERFLLFASSRPSGDESDLRLFISYRTEGGTWTNPVNLSKALGFDKPSRFPGLSPDGKYLFFLSGNDIYWVKAGILQRLRPEAARSG